ncbi:MAG: M48 family metallopeptidase, partial [Pseudomonadales bacterium]|nr:M48 family metallopeptidase [Pseudomonadales bacterium]
MFGMFYDGKTSRPNPCSLHVDEQGLVQISGFPFVPVSVQRISVTDRVGNTPRFVFFPDGASFETDDQQAADELAKSVRVANQAKPKRWFDAHRLESSFKLAVLSLVISLAILYVMATYGVPAASRWAALQLPEQASHALGDGMMELLDDEYLGPTELSEARQASLTALFDQLIPKPTEVEYKLHFRKGEWIGANALALPGGDIVITDELIKLAKSDDAIRGVLLHEIAHVKYRHSL